jgi:hypothetical protein
VEIFYQKQIIREVEDWKKKMRSHPSIVDNMSKSVQNRLNRIIPEKVHGVVTATIKQMVRAVLFGSEYSAIKVQNFPSLQETETAILERIKNYKQTAAIEGGVTGAGGFLMAMVDFPVLLGIKIKLLFDIAVMNGFDVKDYKERLFILYVFQLAFSSQLHRQTVFKDVENWEQLSQQLPNDMNEFNWRPFQQEYRDHIDLAKMAQLIPGIGAVVGVVVNYRLIKKLGYTAMNAYRMRLLAAQSLN